MKKLLICEKPSVAMDISQVLPGHFERKDGFLEGDNLVITWAYGHLVDECSPEEYNPDLKKWDIERLPIMPDPFQLSASPGKEKQLKIIKTIADRTDIGSLINGCDSAREGELIFRRITHYLLIDKPQERLWLSETTNEAIIKAFNNLQPACNFDNLSYAAESRSQADWLVGINGTRGLTCHYREKLTTGRVQTPTLALIVNREKSIKEFKPESYYEIWATFRTDEGDYKGLWIKDKITRHNNKADAEQICENLIPASQATVIQVIREQEKKPAPRLFSLTDLQKEGNERLGLTADQVLNIAQKLYESKLITYPRTDSRYLTELFFASENSSLLQNIFPRHQRGILC